MAYYSLIAEKKEHEDKDCRDKGLNIPGEAVQQNEYDYERNPDNLL